jgi:hypothetical protein
MSCCGGKREAMRQKRAVAVLPPPPPPAPFRPGTRIIFKGTGSYLVTGPRTREVYRFSADRPEQSIDPEDAKALLKSGLFSGLD